MLIRKSVIKKGLLITTLILSIFLLFSCNDQRVKDLEITPPTKTEYYIGEDFDASGLVVRVLYSDDSREVITDYTLSGFDSSTLGEKTVTVSYQAITKTFLVVIIEDARKEVQTTKIKTYDVPEILKGTSNLDVSVNGRALFVYETLVNNQRIFSWGTPTTTVPVVIFDFEGKVKVEITTGVAEIFNVAVKPSAYGIVSEVAGGKITFDLEYPTAYTVEYQIKDEETSGLQAVHIFANPIEEDEITESDALNDDSLYYIGPGIYKTDTIPLKDNQTVYIAGGAVLYGQFNAYNLKNITIRGRGVISGSIYPRTSASERTIPMEF